MSEKVNKVVSLYRVQTGGFRAPRARELTLRSLVGFRAQLYFALFKFKFQ